MEVIVTSPWIPAEWIKAHGHEPRGVWFHPGLAAPRLGLGAGACPFAQRVLCFAEEQREVAFIFSSHCDQLRRAYDSVCDLEKQPPGKGTGPTAPSRGTGPTGAASERTFLFNLPATWQSGTVRRMILAELKRLGNFLVQLGGQAPSAAALAQHLENYRAARTKLAQAGCWCHGSAYAKALAQFHWEGKVSLPAPPTTAEKETGSARLALLGGPFGSMDWELLTQIEALGGHVVLNATEAGERSLVPHGERRDARHEHGGDLTEELADTLLAQCVDVFQRPNTRLYAWLEQRLAERKVQGLLLWHYVGCDLWRAEAESLRETFKLPLLLLEADEAGCLSQRNLGRVQAFLEALGCPLSS